MLQAKYASRPVNAIAPALPAPWPIRSIQPDCWYLPAAAANTVLVYPALSGNNFRGPFCNQMVYFHA